MLTMFNAGSYIIHLYDKIDGCFVCPQIKLEKILILAQIHYHMLYKSNLISDIDIVFAEDCGFSLDTRKTFFRTPITTSNEYDDKCLDETYLDILNTQTESRIFNFSEEDISEDNKKFLIDVFMKYASYKPRTLGSILDKIKECDLFKQIEQSHGNTQFEIPLDEFYKMVENSNFMND